jgi:4'-phosphopantetheinyl transferase
MSLPNKDQAGVEAAAGQPAIMPGEVHLWRVQPERITNPALLKQYLALLTDEEKARQERYRFPQHRHQFLVTRALVRTVLSRYADVDPADWRFETNAYGRPEIAVATAQPLRFNLSHTRGMAICGVTLEYDIGVDVENVDRRTPVLNLASRYFSPSEVADLFALPPERQSAAFFDYWTLKESYIKAKGKGLAIPLSHFSFHLRPSQPITISFAPQLEDIPSVWQFAQFNEGIEHKIALAVRRGERADLTIVVRDTVPLES